MIDADSPSPEPTTAALQPASADRLVEPGFEMVADEFDRNFSERGDIGAAFAATLDGQLVLDLWGGEADSGIGLPWRAGTLQLIFSGTKGLVAVCILRLIEQGLLDLDQPVCHYWPEFASAGKENVLVRDIVRHAARLPGVRVPLEQDDILDDQRMASLLAVQPQEMDPRAALCYHPLTYGWLCGELVRRVDGRSVGRFFAEEIAKPLRLEIWIGLPPELLDRVAKLELASTWTGRWDHDHDIVHRDPLVWSTWANPSVFGRDLPWNRRSWLMAEMPAVNAVGTARSMALLYGSLVADEGAGTRILAPATVELGRRELARGYDAMLESEVRFAVGFALNSPRLKPFGPPDDAFGAGGAGGSCHGAWPSQRVGFSYAMNQMRDDVDGDPRARALLGALHRAVVAYRRSA